MKKRYIICALTLIGFVIVTFLLLTNNITKFDDVVYNFFYQFRDNNIVRSFFIFITRLGDTTSFAIICLILLIVLKREDKLLLLSNVITVTGSNQLIKHIIKRTRPPVIEHLVKQGGFSYPSGHTMTSTCLYGILIYIILKNVKNKKLRITLTILCMFMIVSIGLSRIFVRVHYPSDVLSGYLLTISLMIMTTELMNHFLGGKKNEKDVCK